MNIDFHCHTKNSYDGFSTYDGLSKAAREKNIDVIFITEHDKINSKKNMFFKLNGITFIKGCEFTTDNGSHIIGLFIDQEFDGTHNSYSEIFKHIKKNNGLISIPHPFKPDSGFFYVEKNNIYDLDLSDVDLIELYNGGYQSSNDEIDNIKEIAKKNKMKLIGVSDAHKENHLGYYVTNYDSNETDLIKMIKNEQGNILFDSSFKLAPRKIYSFQKNSFFKWLRNRIKYEKRMKIKRIFHFFKRKIFLKPLYTLKFPID